METAVDLASHPVYTLRLDNLSQGGGLDETKASSWRIFVVDSQDEPVGVAEVAPVSENSPTRFLGYFQGQQIASSGKVLHIADQENFEGHFEPRFLVIPGLNTTALWLKNLDSGDDKIIPIDPIPRFLLDQATYTTAEFLNRVQPMASRRLTFEDEPRISR